MTFADEQDGERRRKSAPSPDGDSTEDSKTRNGRGTDDSKPRAGRSTEDFKLRKKRANTPEVGHALRAAYQQTINEDIPPDLLDLLGKLG